VPYLSASEVTIHEEALYQVYVPLPFKQRLHVFRTDKPVCWRAEATDSNRKK